MLDSDPKLIEAETKLLPKFDIISTPIDIITAKLQKKCPSAPIKTHPHAINTSAFNTAKKLPSPYNSSLNAIYIGMCPGLDLNFFKVAVKQFPNIQFHIYGLYKPILSAPNLTYHGIALFSDLIPYIVHATIGLFTIQQHGANINLKNSAKSLKYMQYTYAKLPIIAPQAMQITEPHVFSYTNDPTSIKTSIERALNYPKEQINTDDISSWDDLIQTLLDSCR
jgi:2-beta-glucuronyltransferase